MSGASLAGRRALVTGAARRTGKALALALASEGADVAVHYRQSAKEAEAAADAIRALGQNAVAVQADLTHAEEAERGLQRELAIAQRRRRDHRGARRCHQHAYAEQ